MYATYLCKMGRTSTSLGSAIDVAYGLIKINSFALSVDVSSRQK